MQRLLATVFALLFSTQLLAQVPVVEEHPCKVAIANARCGSIAVPEDHSNPASRKTRIEFVQIRSTAPDRDSAAWIDVAGGPGVAGTPGAADLAGVFGYVLKRRDIILYDQRGTNPEHGLHCDPHEGVTKPKETADFLPEEGVRICWQQVSGQADLAKYNTAQSVEDLDQLRAALGYDKLVLHALSYGTRLSQAYVQAHPEHVRAAVLEGVLQPGTRIPLGYAKGMQKVLEHVIDECRHDTNCKPAAEGIDLKKVAREKMAVTVAGKLVDVTPGQFAELLRSLLYDGEGPTRVPLLLQQVTRGNFSRIPELYEHAYRDDTNFSWPLYLSVTCAEDLPFIRDEDVGAATKNTLMGDYRIRQQKRVCKSWPVPPLDPAVGTPTDVPVLLMEGELDLVTPPWPEDAVKRVFPHGRQVVMPLVGHMPTGLDGIECFDEIEGQFLEKLDNKELDVSCREKVRRKPFLVAK